MKLPSIKDLPMKSKKVILRTDFDGDSRIENSLETIRFLLERSAKIIIISHLGRPNSKVVEELSLRPVAERLGELLGREIGFMRELGDLGDLGEKITFLENLRFWPEEENNNEDFARQLASLGDVFVNEAFAVSHRNHASVAGIPKFLPSCFGFHFLKEVEALSQVRENSKRPVVLILGGEKEDKLGVLGDMGDVGEWRPDYVLVGGKLPTIFRCLNVQGFKRLKRIITAELNEEAKDITLESVDKFRKIISKAKTIVWAGPMGVFEEEKFANGTREIAKAIAESKAFKVAGGGETEAALEKFGLKEKFNFVSSGGGAMLEFLGKGEKMAGIAAILNSKKRYG